jgi:uncharacterized protein (TIGR03437 family)
MSVTNRRSAVADFRFWILILFTFLLAQPAVAQNWGFVGPLGAPARILALAADPQSTSVIYLAAPGGGVWKTQDGGITWTPQLDSTPSLQVCSLVLDPSFPNVIYLGTGDDQSPRPGQGVGRSADGGRTWTFFSRFTNQPVCALAVDPTNSTRIFAGSAEGLFISSDTGATWTKALDSPVTSVAFDGRGAVYAGMLGEDGPGAREQILARSADGGLTWASLVLPPNPNAAAAETNWVSVLADASSVSVVVSYPLTTTLSSVDFYRSTDSGGTWSAPLGIGQARLPMTLFAGRAEGSLYIAANNLLGSVDAGLGWSTITTTTTGFHALAFTGGALLLGGDKGLEAVSLVQGTPAPAIAQLPLSQILGVAIDSVNAVWAGGPGGLYGPLSRVVETRVSGIDATGNVAAAATGSTNIFASANGRTYSSTDGGAKFSVDTVLPESELRAPYPPLLLDPVNTLSAYVAGQRLYHTTNSGTSWTTLAVVDPDPTHVVIALAIAPASRSTLYAATACLPEVALASCRAGSQIWVSRNAGTNWIQLSPVAGLVNRLAVDPRQTNLIYAAVGAFPAGPSLSAGSVPGDLVRSMNGQPWTSVRGNLPETAVNAVVIDSTSLPTQPTPGNPGVPGVPVPGVPGFPGGFFNQPAQTIYVGTDAGVFVSFNAGTQWTDISSSLPPAPVTDLALRQPGGILVASTFGRGVYSTTTTGLAAGVIASRLSMDVTLVQGTAVTTGVPLVNASISARNSWRLNPLDSWITVPEQNGVLGPSASAQVAIRVSAAGLPVGIYLGRLELITGPYVQNILIEAHVTAAPAQMRIVSANNVTGAAGSALAPFQVLLSDANQVPLPGITVNFAIASGGGSLSALNVRTNTVGVASTVLTLPATPGTVRVAATSGDLSATFNATAVPPPTLLANSVVDGVTFNAYTPLGPGSILSILGQNLVEGSATAGNSLLPTVLQNTRVLLVGTPVGDVALPLLSVSPHLVKAFLPFDVAPGIYRLAIEMASRRSNEIQISVAAFAPGIFTLNENGRGAGIFIKDDGSVVTSANPADRGSRVTFYAAGLGAVNPPIPAGQAGASGEPLNRTVRTPRVFFDTYAAEMIYSGLVPGVAGRYQVTVRVPSLVSPATNISVSLTIGGFSSNRVTIPVR